MQNDEGLKLNAMPKLNILLSNGNSFRDKDEVLKDFLREQFDQSDDIFKLDEIIMAAGHYGYYQLAIEMQKDLNTVPGYKVITTVGLREVERVNREEVEHG